MERPRLQLALDLLDLDAAVDVTTKAHSAIDIIEVGTLLCLSEGMNAIRTMRAKFPDKTIVGDVRIVRAGKNIADMAFDAGADWVSVVAEAPRETLEAAVKVAESYSREIQIELADEWSVEDATVWRELGIKQVICHDSSEVGTVGGPAWSRDALDTVQQLSDLGFEVTATGGITPVAITDFSAVPVGVFIAGRSICQAPSPLSAAEEFQAAIEKTYG